MSQAALASRELARAARPAMVERRALRSSFRAEALELMVTAYRRNNHLEALAIADDHGLLLAGSSESGIDLNTLATLLPESKGKIRMPNLSTVSFNLESARLHVGAIGAAPSMNSLLAQIILAAKRILTY